MTQVGFGPLHRIDGPPPLAPVYSLLAAAGAPAQGVRIVPDADSRGIERWMNGVEVYGYPPDTGGVWDTCASSAPIDGKGTGAAIAHPQFGAFTAYLNETCTSYKVWNQDEYKSRALSALTAVESSIVAREFKRGTILTANPHLNDGLGTFPNADTATSFWDGIALLEDEIAASGRQGIIHCSPGMISAAAAKSGWNYWHDTAGQVIRMISGTVIIPDAGYTGGGGPIGHASPTSGQEWIYATGPVDIRRSEAFVTPENVSQALERGTGGADTSNPNSITYRAERFYLIDWDTEVQAAVLVDRCLDSCANPS